MRQFDVYENPVASMREARPYMVVLSSHLLPDLTAVLVAPLIEVRAASLPELSLPIDFGGKTYVLVTLDMAAIASRSLSRKAGDLIDHEYDIRRALDRLFTGF